MKNKLLFFYSLLSLFYISTVFTGDLTKTPFTTDIIENLMTTAGISKDSKEATRIRQLAISQIDFLVKCTKTLKDYENNIDQMSKYKDFAVTRDNKVVKLFTIDTNGSQPYVKDNRYVTTTESIKSLEQTKEPASQKNGNLALLLTEIPAIALGLIPLAKIADGNNNLQNLQEDPSDSLELKTLKGMLLYLYYENELFNTEMPVALSEWTIKTKNPTALGFLEYAYEENSEYTINQKERDILMAFIKTQPHALEIIDKTIEVVQINYKYMNDARWDESAFSKKSRNNLKTLINNFMAHSTTVEKIYDTNRSYLASKKQVNLLRKYSPLFNDVDLEVASILPAKLLSKETNEIAAKTAIIPEKNSNIPKEKSQTNNTKKNNKKPANANKAMSGAGTKNQAIKKNDDQSQKENVAPIVKTIATKNADNVLPIAVPKISEPEDLTTKFLNSLPAKYSMVHYNADRFRQWHLMNDGYHDAPHLLDLILMQYGSTRPWEGNPTHTVYYAPIKITRADGSSDWYMGSLTMDDKKIVYHRHLIKTINLFAPSVHMRLGPNYDKSILNTEYPLPSSEPKQKKLLTNNDSGIITVEDIINDQSTKINHGTISVLSKLLHDAQMQTQDKNSINVYDQNKKWTYTTLLKQ